jgi:hypothetical protein
MQGYDADSALFPVYKNDDMKENYVVQCCTEALSDSSDKNHDDNSQGTGCGQFC